MIALLAGTLGAAWAAAWAPLHLAAPTEIDSLLADARWCGRTAGEKLLLLADLRAGTPYALGPLGEGKEPDRDPIFLLDRADCTVLVVTDAALLAATSLEDAAERMEKIHYRGGDVSYQNRYHFTVDRILSSPYFDEITGEVAPDSLLREVRAVLNRKSGGERLLDIPWEKAVSVRFLPSRHLTGAVIARLPRAAGVVFVNGKNREKGYLASHEGIVLEGTTLHHASSSAGKVVNVPFLEYVEPEPGRYRFDGLLFFAFRPTPEKE